MASDAPGGSPVPGRTGPEARARERQRTTALRGPRARVPTAAARPLSARCRSASRLSPHVPDPAGRINRHGVHPASPGSQSGRSLLRPRRHGDRTLAAVAAIRSSSRGRRASGSVHGSKQPTPPAWMAPRTWSFAWSKKPGNSTPMHSTGYGRGGSGCSSTKAWCGGPACQRRSSETLTPPNRPSIISSVGTRRGRTWNGTWRSPGFSARSSSPPGADPPPCRRITPLRPGPSTFSAEAPAIPRVAARPRVRCAAGPAS